MKAYFVCAALLAAPVLIGGCSSDDPAEPAKRRMMSDVADLVIIHEFEDGDLPVYEYEGVEIWGDIPLGDYSDACQLADPLLADNETLFEVFNFRAFPESYLCGRPPAEFELRTCVHWQGVNCAEGNWYRFIREKGGIVPGDSGWWHVITK